MKCRIRWIDKTTGKHLDTLRKERYAHWVFRPFDDN